MLQKQMMNVIYKKDKAYLLGTKMVHNWQKKGAELTQKGADLTQNGADLTQKGAELTHFQLDKRCFL